MQQTVDYTRELIESGSFAHLIGVNADKALQARDEPEIAAILERCEVVNADGASMVLAAKWLGTPLPERVAGIDLMQRLCELARDQRYSVYLLGAKTAVVEEVKTCLELRIPGIKIVGLRDGYFDDQSFAEVAEQIQRLSPNLVFVGITSPKKERVIEFCRDAGARSVFVGVGGSFDVISGAIPRAPRWMQRINLEWLFRMLKEPKRLFRRYLVGNTRFLLLVAGESFKRFRVSP